jgi:Domain of unknown function (DUF4411)
VKYSIDTSAFVDWWIRFYPPKNFPSLIDHVGALIAAGDLRASREVLEELMKQDDELAGWAKDQQNLFIEDGEVVQDTVTVLMDRYFNPEKPDKGISGADPFVIGLALTNNHLTVVSGEKLGSRENPKIPYVCRAENVPHINFLGLIQAEGWEL